LNQEANLFFTAHFSLEVREFFFSLFILMLAGNIASFWVSCCSSFSLSTSYDDTNKLSKRRGVCELGLCYCCIQIFSSL